MTKSTKSYNVRRTLHYFWSATIRYRFVTIFALVSTPVVDVFRHVITPLLFANIVAVVAENPTRETILNSLLPQAILILILRILCSTILGELRIYCHWKMELHAMHYLANLCFDTVSNQSMQFHSDRFSGSLVSQTNKFIGAYERFFDEIVWGVLPMLSTMIAALVILFIKVPIFATGMLALIILYTAIAYIFFKKMAPLNEAYATAEHKRTGQLSDSISNITSVKSYAREAYEHHRYEQFNKAVTKSGFNLLSANISRNLFFDGIYLGFTALILAFLLGGQTWFGLSFATLYLMVSYTTEISGSLWNMNGIFKSLNRVFGDAKDMVEILDMTDDVVDAPDARPLAIKHGAVDFSHITFKHKDAKAPIFTDFSLTIQPGERVGLVGISGSGKTTITRLFLRFADVDDGGIFVDGQNISQVTQQSLRQAIAYVPQETSLFHRSIAENIAYAKPSATMAEITKAAKLANAHEFIKDLPNGYDTLVGERGIKLSGGQRQRIAIARAILKDAPILVLDEATSALDSESEALIQDALKELMNGRTSLVIAHRLSTVANLDRIVVLDNGKIVEQGTHQQLLKAKGPYAKLWSRQSGAFLKESD
ncbi:ABC transporter ATP-binding protein [Candidatus Saccharibacteria bacterium]|nr:ABC transporter ATP-binding protein [Candidatus Saccharibacteria bacterium]